MLSHLRRIAWISLTAAVLGALYSWLQYKTPLPGAVVGAANGAVLPALEIIVLQGGATAILRAAPFLVFLSARIALYAVIVVAIFAATGRLFPEPSGSGA